ncbi:MAG: TatD family hydrolase [Dehalococcoidia bacterium]|nr:TatD family hydrolase [Dehalococcoidia bacterium]
MHGLVDTHAHLDEIEEIDRVLSGARQSGLDAIIAVGQDLHSNRKTIELASQHPGFVYPSIGLHPWAIGNMPPYQLEENIDFIRQELKNMQALGEVGLDYDKRVLKTAGKDIQKDVLRKLLEIALKNNKPVSLHSRYAWKDSLALVKEMGIKRLVFHWYTGFSGTLAELLEAGYYVSATPAAEYHDEHRRTIREAPTERLLLETDCPVYYGRENKYRSQPSDVLRSLRAAAEIKGISLEELAEETTRNAHKLFKLP